MEDNNNGGNSFLLLCPECQEGYLHQEKVDVIFRDMEDSDGTLTSIDNKKVTSLRMKDRDIPGRRDVMYITFHCECCNTGTDEYKRHTLEIMQHKGNTYFDWVKIKDGHVSVIPWKKVK